MRFSFFCDGWPAGKNPRRPELPASFDDLRRYIRWQDRELARQLRVATTETDRSRLHAARAETKSVLGAHPLNDDLVRLMVSNEAAGAKAG